MVDLLERIEVLPSTPNELAAPEVLGEIVLSQHGNFRRIRRYLRGWHPEAGILQHGWQGPETIMGKDSIRPSRVFMVGSDSNG